MKEHAKIELRFNRNDFEEIYFSNDQGSYYKDPRLKKRFNHLLISGVLFALLLYNLITDDSGSFFTLFIGVVFIFNSIAYLLKVGEVWKLRNKVKEYLNDLALIKKHTLILKEDVFEILLDEKKYTTEWSSIKKVMINYKFIYFDTGDENFLIPQKSMRVSDYEFLSLMVKDKLKDIIQ